MSGRRSKQIRKKMAVGALVAYSAFGTRVAVADESAIPNTTAAGGPVAELPLRRFDIAAGTLDEVLRAFEAASGVDVRYSFPADMLSRIGSGGVSGTMSSHQALDRLLDGTGIDYRFDSRRVATITMQQMVESIDVVSKAAVVSSPKFTQPVLDTPRTLTVIPDEVFTAQGATTLRDVLRNTPGITFQAGEGGGGLPGDTFSMRGFSSGNDITVDGIREAGAYSREAFNLAQVEVVKGPSSAVAGRGSTGGSINLVTKTPQQESFTHVSGAAGTDSYSRSTVDANLPMTAIADSAFRVNAMFGASDVPGRDVAHNSSWGVAPSLAFGLGKPTRFTLAYQHIAQDNIPDYGLPWAAFGASPSVDQSNFYGLEDYDYENIESNLATATFEHDLRSGWVLRNISRWGANDRDSAITSPRPPNRQLQRRTMEMTQLTNQASLNGSFTSGGLRHDLALGLEVGREGAQSRNQSQTANQPQVDINHPDSSQDPFGPMPANLGNPSETNLDLVALYAFDTVQLSPKWELTGGARFDSVDVDYNLLDRATGLVTELARADEMLSWGAGAVYKPRKNASIYASFGTSFNASVDAGAVGAALSDVPTAANNINLEPEKTENLEIGGKWEVGNGRAIVTGALFRTTKTNARTRSATTEPFVLDGEQQVDGVEIGVNGHLTERWTVLAGYSHLKSEFVRSSNPAEEGAQLAFTPENTVNVWTDYRLNQLSFGGGVQYMDSVFRNAANTAEVPSYWLAGAMAAYEVTNSLTLRLNANNLTNAHYVDRIGGGHYIPGPGRSLMLTAELGF
jgi:catecholate siderophore receptor